MENDEVPPLYNERLPLLQVLAHHVEQTGIEQGVALFVGGSLITGKTTPTARFFQWYTTAMHLAAATGSPMPTEESSPPTEEERRATAAAWQALEERHEIPRDMASLTLRAVQVALGTGQIMRFAYLQVAFDSIDGFAFGSAEG
ncbi:MAG: hypothetical protein ACLPKW_10075 [Acetobacteraceae bacterium]